MRYYDERYLYEAFQMGDPDDPLPEWFERAIVSRAVFEIGGTHYEINRTDGVVVCARVGEWIVMQIGAPTTIRAFPDEDFREVFTPKGIDG